MFLLSGLGVLPSITIYTPHADGCCFKKQGRWVKIWCLRAGGTALFLSLLLHWNESFQGKGRKSYPPPPIQADSFPGKAHSPKTGSYSHSEAATEMKHSPHPPAPDRLCFCCHVSALPQLGSCPMDYISVA